MNFQALLAQIALGEDGTRQFKADVRNGESLASEMAAFANANGGTLFIGVADDGATPGLPEIPESVFEELLVNALVHRDYLVSAPIRLFIFDNRIEIISPGHLPNNLTVAKIRAGNSNIRNPILVSYVAKGLLPYHGLGSGIKRALDAWPEIEFSDDQEGCLFTVTVYRKQTKEQESADKGALKGQIKGQKIDLTGQPDPVNDLLNAIKANPTADYQTLADALGVSEATIKRQIQKLKQQNRILRIGSKKAGHWQVLE